MSKFFSCKSSLFTDADVTKVLSENAILFQNIPELSDFRLVDSLSTKSDGEPFSR